MTSAKADEIVDTYMKRLQQSLASLPAERRNELTREISDHIAMARSRLDAESEADVLTILDRLGEPDDIAKEADDTLTLREVGVGPLDLLALLLIGVGGVVFPIFPIGMLLGAGLVWRSKVWTPRQKLYGVYVPLVAALVVLVIGGLTEGFAGGVNTPFALVFFGAALLSNLVLPLGVAIYLGALIAWRTHWLAWIAIGIVAVIVYLPAAGTVIPPRTYAYIGPEGPPGGSQPVAGRPGCGGFYATSQFAVGLPLVAKAPLSVGVCWDGQRVTKEWGPDCYPDYGPGLIVEVTECTVVPQPDGSMIVAMSARVHALTAPFFVASVGHPWRISPDGHVT